MTIAAPIDRTGRGIAYMLLASSLLSVQDAITKWLTADYHTGEIILFRGLATFIPILFFIRRDGGLRCLYTTHLTGLLLRGGLALASTLTFVTALHFLSLPDTLALAFASPLFITALSPTILGERVGWRRWSAVCFGFLGVLLMIKPSGAGIIQWFAVLALASALGSALRDIVTRKLGATDGATTILFYTTLVITSGGAVVSLVLGIHLPPLSDLPLFLIVGGIAGTAHYLAIQAFRFTQASILAPFKYVSLIWGTILGFVIWGDLPGSQTVAGAGLVVAGGLYIIYRERKLYGRS